MAKQSGNRPGSLPQAYKDEVEPYAQSNPAFGHIENDGWYFTYSGTEYLSSFTAVTGCPRCGEGATETKYGGAMITVYGYSSSLYGDASVSFFIKVDTEAIAVYEELSGKEVKYGFIAAAKEIWERATHLLMKTVMLLRLKRALL